MQKFPADATLQQQCAGALELMFVISARMHGAVRPAQAAAAVSVLVAALQAHADHLQAQYACCAALSNIAAEHDPRHAMFADTFTAGAIKAVVAALQTHSGGLRTSRDANKRYRVNKLVDAALLALMHMQQECTVNTMRMVHAGALGVVNATLCASLRADGAPTFALELAQQLQRELEAAARAHAAQPCTRCADMRARGAMCALPGCMIRKQPDGTSLDKCSRCMTAAYCCAAHQREAWPEHKKACRAMQRAAGAGGASAS
jgi:hypothetical protein